MLGSFALLEIFVDASFAPANQKSQAGVVATFGGAAVAWLSTKPEIGLQTLSPRPCALNPILYTVSPNILNPNSLNPKH